jgi:tetratricopeptide (TPR) repeat protein
MGRSGEAEAIYRQLAAFERATFGGSRHQLVIAQSELGFAAFFGRADTTAALEHLRQAVALLRGSPEWRTTLAGTTLWNYASFAETVGDLPAAGAAYRDALAIYEATTDPAGEDVALAKRALGRVLAAQGACASAAPLLEASLPPLGEPGSAFLADARSGYGACLARAGRTADARRQLRDAVALFAADTTARATVDPRARLAARRLAALPARRPAPAR